MNICFTAIFSNYDTLHDPLIVSDGWKYYCFTDQDFKSDIYQIIKMTPIQARFMDRYIKLNPHLFLPNHYRSIWHDGSFTVNCDLNTLHERFVIKHPLHDCVYKEIDLCLKLKKDSVAKLEKARTELLAIDWPKESGCFANGLIGRVNDLATQQMNALWWEYLNEFTIRDQIFAPYLYKKFELQYDVISWNKALEYFKWHKHNYRK